VTFWTRKLLACPAIPAFPQTLRLGRYGGRPHSSVQAQPLEVGISQSSKAAGSDDGQLNK